MDNPYAYLATFIAGIVLGGGVMYFVMRNNPKLGKKLDGLEKKLDELKNKF